MHRNWFRPWGWIYRPVSWQGAVMVLIVVVFCVQARWIVIPHSVSDTFYGVFPYFVPSFMLLNWVASKMSGRAV